MEYKDYYAVMGVERDATQDEIKRAYRKLARKFHPDVSDLPDTEARFKEVGEAYEALKDPEKRAAYDELGASWKAGEDFRPPPDWAEGFEFHGGDFTGADAAQFSDFFGSLFGQGGPGGDHSRQAHRGFHTRGEDTHAKVLIDLEDAYRGAARTITLKHTEIGSDGRPVVRERSLKVSIPKGMGQGQHIRLAGQGGAGMGGGAHGDLYLEIEFRPHRYYSVEGRDVYLDLDIAPWEAALGAAIQVPTPAGVVDLKIPPDSSAGRKLRLKGRGIPATPTGDMYVVLRIALPKADSEASKAAYAEFKKAVDFNPRDRLEA